MYLLHKLKRAVNIIVLVVPTMAITLGAPLSAMAAVQNASPSAKISFTFDDGLQSSYTQAAPTLAKYGLTGTNYVISGCVGMTTTPNSCYANGNTTYMTWAQIQALQAQGWEIGSHTVDHTCLASSAQTDPGDCGNKTPLTTAQLNSEMADSKSALAANGINAVDFAPPYGDFNNNVITQVAKYYGSMRQFKNASNNPNVWPYSDYYLQDHTVQETTDTVASIEAQIDNAITNNQWLILTFHNIMANPSTNPDNYEFGTSELDQIAAYVKAKSTQIKSVNIKDGLVTSDVNAMPNGDLSQGITQGWSTNNPTAVKADAGNNGSFPESTNSVYLSSGASTNYLFSPKVPVDSTQTYMFKSFLNLLTRTSGEVGYYVDEYDANGNWISGQWKKAETNPFVEDMNFTYTPSSANVKKASLQVYVTANSGITAYVDNFQMFNLTGPTTPAPTPGSQTDLMTNGTFDNGIGGGWTTDGGSTFVADANNNGSPANPANSVKMTAGSGSNTHLFSPRISVVNGTEYTINAYANLLTRSTNEVGFYVDEYDTSGNWISGKYIKGDSALGAQNLSVSYTPSSANVKTASLQVILPGGSGITGYLDNVQWMAPSSSIVPPPTQTNLVANGSFDSGIASGWSTNTPTTVTADNSSNGDPSSTPTASVKMVPGTANAFLFSPKVTVDSTKSYSLAAYINLKAISGGELGYYVDEYDASGNWISGQWKTAVTTVGARDVSVTYTPTSSNVKSASFQVYTTANSGITAYVDNVRWYQN